MVRVLITIALALSCACTPVRFYGIVARPDGYGGGYGVVAECWVDGGYEPCYYLCSPAIGGKIACGPVPIEWWE